MESKNITSHLFPKADVDSTVLKRIKEQYDQEEARKISKKKLNQFKKIKIPSQVTKTKPKTPEKPDISPNLPILESPSLKKSFTQQPLIPLPEPELPASMLPNIELKQPMLQSQPLPDSPVLKPDALSSNLPKPMLSTSLPEPEAKLPNLEL